MQPFYILIAGFTLLVFITGCNSTDNLQEASTQPENDRPAALQNKVLNLDHDFVIEAGRAQDHGTYSSYRYLQLDRGTSTVMIDSTLNYQFEEKIYPKIIAKPQDRFEILLEVNNAPAKNYLAWIFVESSKLMAKSTLPLFVSAEFDINGDGVFELAGFTNFHEKLIRNGHEFTAYNPILYYSITANGLKLDSALTIRQNTAIYGEFLGFRYDENLEVPAGTYDKFDLEIKKIKAAERK